jgi:hypothetical protein
VNLMVAVGREGFFHTPEVQILWTWHNGRSDGRPKDDAAIDPEGFMRLSFGCRIVPPPPVDTEVSFGAGYIAMMTLISRDSGRAYHHYVPWEWAAADAEHAPSGTEIMFQLFWPRAADATNDKRGIFLFQPTLIALYYPNKIMYMGDYPDELRPVDAWYGKSAYAVAESPHYLLIEGASLWGRRPYQPGRLDAYAAGF